MTYDVAVVGGGPVGLAAAIEARLAGLSVVLVEQRDGIIDKACGEGLMPGAVPLLERLGVAPDGHPLRGVRYQQGDRTVIHRFKGGYGMGVRRTTLHAALVARAAAVGVERITARVADVEPNPTSVTLRTTSDATVEASYVLACDGLHSTMAKLVGLALPAPARGRRYGVRQHYAIAPWTDNIEIYYGPESEIYVTPVSDAVVGFSMLARQHTDFDAALAAIPPLAARVAEAEIVSARRGAGPFRQKTRARTAGRVLLVGDASGYVDAITGEGLRLGFAQAADAVQCISRNRPQDYERAWARTTRDFRVVTNAMVFAATTPLRAGIVPLAASRPDLFGSVVERLAR
jgi:flavin-dependent dehydrogenase